MVFKFFIRNFIMSIISLDWREPIDSTVLLDKMHKVMTAMDVDGFYPIELSTTGAASAAAFKTDNGVPMIVRHPIAKNKHVASQL